MKLSIKLLFKLLLGIAIVSLLGFGGIVFYFNGLLIENQRNLLIAGENAKSQMLMHDSLLNLYSRQENRLMARTLRELYLLPQNNDFELAFNRGIDNLKGINQNNEAMQNWLSSLQKSSLQFLSLDNEMYFNLIDVLENKSQLRTQVIAIENELKQIREIADKVGKSLSMRKKENEQTFTSFFDKSNFKTNLSQNQLKEKANSFLKMLQSNGELLSEQLEVNFFDISNVVHDLSNETSTDDVLKTRNNKLVQLTQNIRSNLQLLNDIKNSYPGVNQNLANLTEKTNALISILLDSKENVFTTRQNLNEQETSLNQVLQQIQESKKEILVEFNHISDLSEITRIDLLVRSDHIQSISRIIIIGLIILVICIMGMLGYMLSKIVAKSFDTLINAMHDISADDRNLSIQIAKTSFNDLNQLGTAFNTMSSRLQAAYTNLQRKTEELGDAQRKAGRSEVASFILHSIGNILNSVVVSIGVLKEHLSNTAHLENLSKTIAMIKSNLDKLPFFVEDTKGKLIPSYLETVTTELINNRTRETNEILALEDNVQKIEKIVATQNEISGESNVSEKLFLPEIIDLAVDICNPELEKTDIIVKKILSQHASIVSDKSKLIQIFTNLIYNAKDALLAVDDPDFDKQITINLDVTSSSTIVMSVSDNGIGIEEENLTKIFALDANKHEKYGFGLHNSANLAKELGGGLEVISDGLDQGATFILTLPQ